MLLRFAVTNYRSLQQVSLELDRVNVVVGPNGSGKTNLYQALHLLAQAARGQFVRTMAHEGGLSSVAWAGPKGAQKRKRQPFRMTFEVGFEELCYRMALGYPPPSESTLFSDDPEIKEEVLWPTGATERAYLFRRTASSIQARDEQGRPFEYPFSLASFELGLHALREPHRFPFLELLRSRMRSWRFYHGFRSDLDAPARSPQPAFHAPVLHEDGSNLAAAIQTIIEIGDGDALRSTIAEALEGASVSVARVGSLMELEVTIPALQRPLSARELSDGQLRFLCLAAALLSPRPPRLLVFNEPEASLHSSLLEPLARLIEVAGQSCQIWLTTHSTLLADSLAQRSHINVVELTKTFGATCPEPRY